MSDAIAVQDLSAEYLTRHAAPVRALRGITLSVPAGGVLGVLGESGSGKSTLARILTGTLTRKGQNGYDIRIIGGDATVNGTSLRSLSRRQQAKLTFHTAFLEQDASARLDRTSTVAENIASPIFERDKHFSRHTADMRVARLLEAVQLSQSAAAAFPYELSEGQRQRVAIARALVLGPNALVADEPTAGVDVSVRDAVLQVFSQLRADPGFAALVVTHDLGVLRALDARVAVLHEGTLVGYGDVDEVLANATHPFVARLAKALAGE